MVRRTIITLASFFVSFFLFSQSTSSYDSLKGKILALETEVNETNLNLTNAQNKFQSGALIATLGYTTTIAGGLMLGRSNDEAGQALLIAGGVTGVIGTYKMVDAFRYLTGRKKKKKKKGY